MSISELKEREEINKLVDSCGFCGMVFAKGHPHDITSCAEYLSQVLDDLRNILRQHGYQEIMWKQPSMLTETIKDEMDRFAKLEKAYKKFKLEVG